MLRRFEHLGIGRVRAGRRDASFQAPLAARPGEEVGPGLRRHLRGAEWQDDDRRRPVHVRAFPRPLLRHRREVYTASTPSPRPLRHAQDYDVNGRRTLPPILHSHKPIDVLVIMLGTNDLKKHLNLRNLLNLLKNQRKKYQRLKQFYPMHPMSSVRRESCQLRPSVN